MAGSRITAKPALLMEPLQGAVQMRMKSSQSSGERLSQSRSMVLQESDLPQTAISRHRRNQSQHNVLGVGGAEPPGEMKGDLLNVAKISDSGKKQRKNWTGMWSELTSDQLLLHKEKQQEAVMKAGGKTDVVQLCGALIEWTPEKSSRKNVFQITTNTGSEYLLQADSQSTASKWFGAIRKTVDSSSKLPLRRSNSTEFLPRHSSLPGHGSTSSNTKQRNPVHRRSINMFVSSKLKHSASDSADKSGVKNRLKKFIIRRPSMKTLQEKGLIKDRVFGCHLLTLCEREGSTVPRFVQLCLNAIEKRGLEVDGIYRVSGNLATIQKLRFVVDQEIKEPGQKVQAVKKLIQDLPKPNQDTMKLLFTHLHRVLGFSRKNLMSTQGIGIVFGPTLMWPELDAGNMAFNMVYQNQIVEFILIESPEIFNLDRK
ncbi:rho GTPase-activating protein 15 isoform X3 [Eleginops maclovinus]|uniref:rho GTPase-activating protein 15 isoform X3 n=1 Tax=Eleginops maclovinus TaxID=56733 RepID=UPI00307FFA39